MTQLIGAISLVAIGEYEVVPGVQGDIAPRKGAAEQEANYREEEKSCCDDHGWSVLIGMSKTSYIRTTEQHGRSLHLSHAKNNGGYTSPTISSAGITFFVNEEGSDEDPLIFQAVDGSGDGARSGGQRMLSMDPVLSGPFRLV